MLISTSESAGENNLASTFPRGQWMKPPFSLVFRRRAKGLKAAGGERRGWSLRAPSPQFINAQRPGAFAELGQDSSPSRPPSPPSRAFLVPPAGAAPPLPPPFHPSHLSLRAQTRNARPPGYLLPRSSAEPLPTALCNLPALLPRPRGDLGPNSDIYTPPAAASRGSVPAPPLEANPLPRRLARPAPPHGGTGSGRLPRRGAPGGPGALKAPPAGQRLFPRLGGGRAPQRFLRPRSRPPPCCGGDVRGCGSRGSRGGGTGTGTHPARPGQRCAAGGGGGRPLGPEVPVSETLRCKVGRAATTACL